MIDYNEFIGIPWVCGGSSHVGADCWGIVKMIYLEKFNIEINHFDTKTIDDQQKTTRMIEIEQDNPHWLQVDTPVDGDVVVMIGRLTNRPEHVGVYITRGRVLHSMTRETGQSEIHPVKLLIKVFKRLEYYRYVS